MLTTWYLSVDWQMFLLAPLLIYPAWKLGRKGLLPVLLALIAASTLYQYIASVELHHVVKDLNL